MSSIDLAGRRFVIASDNDGTIHPSAAALVGTIPISSVTSDAAGWGRGLMDPSPVRLAPRAGFALALRDSRAVIRGGYGIFLNQWAYSVQTAFARNLPFFFTKQIDVPSDVQVPTLRTSDMLTTTATGTVGGSIMDYEYQRQVQPDVEWRVAIPAGVGVDGRSLGTWGPGRSVPTTRRSGTCRSRDLARFQPRRPIPELSRINAIRFDGKSIYHGLTLKVERRFADNLAYNVSYTLSHSKDDASSPGATESEANVPQNVRNIFDASGEWALSSFDHRHQFIASAVYQLPLLESAGGIVAAVLGGWRANAIFIAQSGAPFTVNLSIDRANIGAGPAQRPDQLRNPNIPDGERTPERWFDTAAFALQAPFTFGSAPRNSVIGPGYANFDFALAKTWVLRGRQLEFRWEIFNLFNRANFDLPNRIFGNSNFGRIFSRSFHARCSSAFVAGSEKVRITRPS